MRVLDASALLAFLLREPGSDLVAAHLRAGACISAVNLSEVANRYVRIGQDALVVQARLSRLPVEVVPFDKESAFAAARLLPQTSALGLSLGDRACLALAVARRIPAVTADRVWSQLSGVDVEVIR
ncbi:MAG: type II toxin-antitoxin system VapC family toxin [Vulcanimicrobiota bacterium]